MKVVPSRFNRPEPASTGASSADRAAWGAATRVIERQCNTGPDPDGLCPLVLMPMTIIPPMLLED